jgi:hypothetical protein
MASDKAGGGSVVKAHATQSSEVVADPAKTEAPVTEVVPK